MARTEIRAAQLKDEVANADIASNAAVAGTKISPDFGSQNILTTGSIGVGSEAASPATPLHIAAGAEFPATFDRASADAFGPLLNLRSARGTPGSEAIVQDNDSLGGLLSLGYDGSTNISASRIITKVDGTPSSSDIPTRIEFYTFTSGGALTLKMTLDNAGNLGIGTTPSYLLHAFTSSVINASMGVESSVTNSYPSLFVKNDAVTWRWFAAGNSGDGMGFYNGAYRLFIDTSGDVEIGSTTSPNADSRAGGSLTLTGSMFLGSLAGDPSTPVEGQLWYNSTTKQYMGYDGTDPVVLG